ncbi:MAG: ATP-binding protein [Gammaproteobacteria bacterium]|nr:ATP-binding protein [Gammaproteobacteria bacterium]
MTEPAPRQDAQTELENAFSTFNQFAENLASSYFILEQRISDLNEELAAARHERMQELIAKERLAKRLSHLLKALPAGVIVIDGQGVIRQANPLAVKLLEQPLQDELWRNVVNSVFMTGDIDNLANDARLKSGRLVNINTCPLGDEPGQIVHVVDVTETRQLQQKIEHYKRLSALGEMSAKVAHQVRTPVSSALLYLSQLNSPRLNDTERHRYVEKALGCLRHLEGLVTDMLAFTRSDFRASELFSLSDLLECVQHAIEPQLDSTGCRFYLQDDLNEFSIRGNQETLTSALLNLLSNAITASGEGGIVWLKTRAINQLGKTKFIDLLLSDNGNGISKDVRDKVFEPFFTTRASGTGLGLAVARAIVQNHDGQLWLESSSNEGTTFICRLPVAEIESDCDNVSSASLDNELHRSVV